MTPGRGNVPVKTTRFANLIIDAADTLAEGNTSGERWWAINRIANKIGANAVNAGAFQRETKKVAWVRSSMDPLWLEEYEQAAFYEVDPLLHAAMKGQAPPYYDIALIERRLPTSTKLCALHHSMQGYGYNYMIGHSWFEGGAGRCVAISCREDPKDLFGRGTARAFSALSAMIATALIPPGDEAHEGWAYGASWQPLLPAERHVLSLIANGLPEYLIAEAMKVTEFEVWSLIRSASLKMKSQSREQTLALAIKRGQVEL